jgi:predicted RecA/RadA family phage recombinase
MGGVCVNSAALNAAVPIKRRGVFTLPKATGASWSQGDQLYWDGTNKNFTKTSSGNTKWGVAAAAAQAGDATGSVSFTPNG